MCVPSDNKCRQRLSRLHQAFVPTSGGTNCFYLRAGRWAVRPTGIGTMQDLRTRAFILVGDLILAKPLFDEHYQRDIDRIVLVGDEVQFNVPMQVNRVSDDHSAEHS